MRHAAAPQNRFFGVRGHDPSENQSIFTPVSLHSSGQIGVVSLRRGQLSGQCGSPEWQPHATGQKYESGLTGKKTPSSTHALIPKRKGGQPSCPIWSMASVIAVLFRRKAIHTRGLEHKISGRRGG